MALQFRCEDVGVACKSVTKADTADELVAKVADHARKKHGVELTQTLVDYAKTKVTETGRAGRMEHAEQVDATPEAGDPV